MASYATGQGDGHSCVFQADGREVLVAGSETGFFCADLDLGELRAIQRHTYWGKAWRRPDVYGSYEAESDDPIP
jgi:predicted amidohydrolase